MRAKLPTGATAHSVCGMHAHRKMNSVRSLVPALGLGALVLAIITACTTDPGRGGPCGNETIYSDHCPSGLSCLPRASTGPCDDFHICTKACSEDADCLELGVDYRCVPTCGGAPGKVCLMPDRDFPAPTDAGADG
jgi:hypothetical protein